MSRITEGQIIREVDSGAYNWPESISPEVASRIARSIHVKAGDPMGREVNEWGKHSDPDTWSRGVTVALSPLKLEDLKYKPLELGGRLDGTQYAKFVEVCEQMHDGFTQFNALINKTGVLPEGYVRGSFPELWLATDKFARKNGPQHGKQGPLSPFIRRNQVFLPVEDTIYKIALPAFDTIQELPDSYGVRMSERGRILNNGFVLSSFDFWKKLFSTYKDSNFSDCRSSEEYFTQPMRLFGLITSAIYAVNSIDAVYTKASAKKASAESVVGATARRSKGAASRSGEKPSSVKYIAFDPETVENFLGLINNVWESFGNTDFNYASRQYGVSATEFQQYKLLMDRLKETLKSQVEQSDAIRQYRRDKSKPQTIIL